MRYVSSDPVRLGRILDFRPRYVRRRRPQPVRFVPKVVAIAYVTFPKGLATTHHALEIIYSDGSAVYFESTPRRGARFSPEWKFWDRPTTELGYTDDPALINAVLTRIGHVRGDRYGLFSRNCQHVATYCWLGRFESTQVDGAVWGSLAAVGLLAFGVAAPLALAGGLATFAVAA